MSSIDDEFASLFLPDLELLNSVNNLNQAPNPNPSAHASQKRIEEPSMINEVPSGQYNMENSQYFERNVSSSHWLQHYGKLNNTYGLALNHLQQPYIGYNSQAPQILHSQAPNNPSLYADPISDNLMGSPDFLNFQRQPESMDYLQNKFVANDIDVKSSNDGGMISKSGNTPSPASSHVTQNTERQQTPHLPKKKKERSSKFSHLLLLSQEVPEGAGILSDQANNKVNFQSYGEIDGRFLCTEADLANSATTNISCYRRNFIQISFNFGLDRVPRFVSTSAHGKTPITGLKFSVYASTNFSDEKVELLVFDNDKKKGSVDPNTTYMGGAIHEVSLAELYSNLNGKYCLKRTQFRNATPNNGKTTVFQNYYYIMVSVSAITSNGYSDVPLIVMKSVPLKVRGRNPSFYNERDDVLIVKKSGLSHLQESDSTVGDSIVRSAEEELAQVSRYNINSSNSRTFPSSSAAAPAAPTPISSSQAGDSGALEAIDEHSHSSSPGSEGSKTPSNYKYFPLSNVYYLPPVEAHYFPHGVHHPRQSSIVKHRRQSGGQEDKAVRVDELMGRTDGSKTGDKLVPGHYIKMKLMNILNNDNNLRTGSGR